MAKTTLFELKEKMATLKEAIVMDAEWVAEKAADPTTPMEEINTKTAHRDDLQKRYDLLKAEHDAMEAAQRDNVSKLSGESGNTDKVVAKAAFYRGVVSGKDAKAYSGLGAIPANDTDLGHGEKLLPKNVSTDLLTEPEEENPLRAICRVTNITGLEEPKLGFTISDTSIGDVTDKETAKEIALDGDSIAYGRYKMKVKATVKETVYHGADVALVSAVENNLAGALAYREKYFAFLPKATCATDTTHAHMSFYKTDAIKSVEGDTLYDAIVNAYADLADKYSANAKVVMRKADYYGMLSGLTNTAEALFSNKPASILGVPVVFCDKATTPVVGDFSYYGINYDIETHMAAKEDPDKGEYSFYLTAWGDQQIRMKSAFRLATVASKN